jgi:hypothetical protein
MMKIRAYLFAFFVVGVICAGSMSLPANALSLKMQPLLYSDTLDKGELKNGSIDISNPTTETLTLNTSVQAFKQIDSDGNLTFYDDPRITAGLRPDLKEFTLKPGEAIHLVFQLDANKLPSGDVFAALFVSTKQPPAKIPRQVIRLGTLFTLVNGSPGERHAAITSIQAPFFTYGGGLTVVYRVANLATGGVSSGFYPKVDVALQPFGGKQTVTSPLVFAGNSRTVKVRFEGDRLGIYQLSAMTGDSVATRWAVVVTGFWTWLLPSAVGLAIVLVLIWRRRRPRLRYRI